MTNKNNQQVVVTNNRNDRPVVAKVFDFVRMNSSKFLGSQVWKDPQKFIYKAKRIFSVMSVTRSDR